MDHVKSTAANKSTERNTAEKRLVICHGDKGGVGKSTFARLLAEWYTAKGITWRGFDTDATNGHLYRFYPARTLPVVLHEDGNIDQILNAVTGDESIILVDLGARTGEIVHQWCRETDLLTVKDEIGLRITVCFLLDPVKDSTALLKDVVDTFAKDCSYVLVKNQANGMHFTIYDESKTRKRLLSEMSAVEIRMPELLSTTYQQVDAENLSWGEATRNTNLMIAGRQRVKGFLRQSFEQIEHASECLIV